MWSTFTYGHLWQQEELSDTDIVLRAASGLAAADAGDGTDLIRVIPGHSAILSCSAVMRAQVPSGVTAHAKAGCGSLCALLVSC